MARMWSDSYGWIEGESLWNGRDPLPGSAAYATKGSYLMDAAGHTAADVRFTKAEHRKMSGDPLSLSAPKPQARQVWHRCACGRRRKEKVQRCTTCQGSGRNVGVTAAARGTQAA